MEAHNVFIMRISASKSQRKAVTVHLRLSAPTLPRSAWGSADAPPREAHFVERLRTCIVTGGLAQDLKRKGGGGFRGVVVRAAKRPSTDSTVNFIKVRHTSNHPSPGSIGQRPKGARHPPKPKSQIAPPSESLLHPQITPGSGAVGDSARRALLLDASKRLGAYGVTLRDFVASLAKPHSGVC